MSMIGSAVCATATPDAAAPVRNARRERIVREYQLRRLLLVTLVAAFVAAAAEPPTIDEALNHLYNFQFPAAQATLDRIVAAHPNDPLPYAFRASGYLFYELDRLGALEAEFLSTDDFAHDKKKQKPDPAISARMEQALGDAQSRGEAALKLNPNDKNALFALTIVGGIQADYMALVDKRQFGSLTPSKASNGYAQRLLKLDPKFYDAYLTAGFSEYVLGSLPFFVRWFVHWENVNGSKEAGKQHLELAAREGH